MALTPWTIELLRRGIGEVARKASDPETLEKLKTQATEILQDLPETAARGITAVMRSAEAGKRSVVRWSAKQTALSIPLLNATGVLLHEFGTGVPASPSVIDAGYEMLRGDCVQNEEAREHLIHRIEKRLPGDGGFSIAIANSFPAALTAFSQLVQERPLVIHRNHAVRLPGGVPLPEAFGTLLPVIQEVGSVGVVSVDDFNGLDSFCSIVADDGQHSVELIDFADRDAMQAVVLPVGSLGQFDGSLPSAEQMIAAGADCVLLPGNGLCGGPDCGLIIGRRDSVNLITSSPAWPALRAGFGIESMMAQAVEIASTNPEELPIRALLSTAEENLRARAERMAVRLTGSDDISSCQITSDGAKLTEGGRWSFPSRQLRLKHATLSAEQWASDLREEFPAVIARVDGEALVIDLRWIAAADDNKLAGLVGGEIEAQSE
jgi:L-seryl-tRNA(Ser) seleniumtransferase